MRIALSLALCVGLAGSALGQSSNPATIANGVVPVGAGGTGVTTSTGSGSVVLSTSPTLVTPVLGVAAATNLNAGGAGNASAQITALRNGPTDNIGFGGAGGQAAENNLGVDSNTTPALVFHGKHGTTTTYTTSTNAASIMRSDDVGGFAWSTLAAAQTNGAATTLATLSAAGAFALPQITTGTNADVVCLDSGFILRIQAAASCTISSMRFKRDIARLRTRDNLAVVMALRPASFFMKDGAKNPDQNAARQQIGLIAEDVARVDHRLAIYEPDMKTPKSWRLEGVIAELVGAVQAQQREIEGLRAAIR